MKPVAERLLAWYRRARRDLPWRRSRDPYAVWVSEVMLQQTQVATVLPYYERWMQRFPTVHALADASEDEVLHAWQGLGYYSRARSLLKGARAVVERHHGRVPDDVDALLALPGIGPYSAGAIASIAFDRPEPVVDGNVQRVLCRLYALAGDPARAALKRELWQRARELVPARGAADFNQALMELGATVCTPKKPACERCPLSELCAARERGIAERLPETAPRPATEKVHMVAALIWRNGRVLVSQLPASAPRWAGMWQFPTAEPKRGETPEVAVQRAAREAASIDVAVHGLTSVVRHGVTRYRITLDAYRCSAGQGRARGAVAWRKPDELAALALPSAHGKLARKLGCSS